MKRSHFSRFLSLMLALVMVLSMFPAPASAAETATWTKVDPADITAEDTIAVTMTNSSGVTYALYTVQSGTYGPDALVVTVDGDTITTEGTADYGWTVTPVEGGYTLTVGGKYLYTTDTNNGVRIGDTQAVWSIDGTYLSTTDTGGNTRWLGVYDNNNGDYSAVANPNWRAYKNTTGNTKDQTLSFWKLTGVTEGEPEEPVETVDYVLTDELSDGDVVILYNAGNAAALTSTASGYKLAGESLTPADGVISTELTNVLWTVGVNEDGTYTFSQGELVLGMVQSGSYVNLSTSASDGYTAWTLSEGTGDSVFYMKNTNMPAGNYGPYYLEYYSGFTAYASNSPSDTAFGISFYKLPTTPTYTLTDTLSDGDVAVIYNAGNSAALTSTASGYKLAGESLTPADGVISTELTNVLWTVGVNEDGTYTFSQGELVLGMVQSGSYVNLSTSASDGYTAWTLSEGTGDSVFYMKNTNMPAGNYGPYYLEYYSGFTAYASNSPSDTAYGVQFYVLGGGSEDEKPADTKPASGAQVVLYNLSAQGVLAAQDDNADSPSINNAPAAVADGTATPGNGGVVFTVEQNGDYYRFYNETYGYLCSNGTGNNAYYTLEVSEDADWTLSSGKSGGWFLESRTAKYNGIYSQYLEYYGGSYKTYSMYNVTDYDIYEFLFYPVAEGVNLTGSIVNQPTVSFGTLGDAYVGVDYTFSVTVDAVFGVAELTVKYNDAVLTASADGSYYIIGGDTISGESFTLTAEGVDTKGVAFSATATVKVVDEPSITDVAPAAGSETGADKKPVISAVLTNEGEGATVTMTLNGEAVDAVYTPEHTDIDGLNAVYYPSTVAYTPAADLADGRYTVTVAVTRADGKTASKSWSFTVGEAQFDLYFGQLHSHTTYSDGSGSLETALSYIASLPESANVDFVAFTDHSNYFDTSSNANPEGALYDMSLASESSQALWAEYKNAVAEFNATTDSGVIAIAGFEMTWSGGPGHINTFATEGIVSRNNSVLNNKTADAGMKAYYALLSQAEGIDSISQFNHPGTTFGNFTDFAYWDAVIDSRVYLVEVGNGEGAIGAGGYYPSYEQYTMALDKGWHVAPTNNQDNHKGKWGNANDARDVVLTDDFSEEGIYEAIRNYRVYATEDKNLEVYYTVNGLQLGSTIEEIPETLNVAVSVYDPDSSDSVSKVEVIVNSGKVAYTWDDPAVLATGELTAQLAPDYSYYYIRVTEGDGDLAVTAPVWVGETLKLGISAVETSTTTPVTDEELTISTTLFNSELTDATINSLTYTVGDEVIAVDNTGYTIPASGNTTVDFAYVPTAAKVMNITVTAYVTLDGIDYTFSMDIELDVQDASKLVYIGIDASHYNEYVNGNYKDSMGNFGALAAGYNVRTVILYSSEELIAACENEKYVALILTAPSRRNGNALRDPYVTYSDEEIDALVAFNANGGALILTGWGDYYESYADFAAGDHMAAQQNKILAAVGSSLRISDDETKDDTYNGGQSQRLYLSVYDFDSFLLDGVDYDAENPHDNMYTELYSHYGASSIYAVDENGDPTTEIPATVTPTVYGFDTTKSVDDDGDNYGGLGAIPTYTVGETQHLMVMATEQLEGQGLIVVAGGAFMSNFEVQATTEDSGAEKNYSNYKICENLLSYLNPVEITDIATVQATTESGIKYTIEGVVTSNASGYDKDTAFFDCIYVQDATGGVCCFPVAGNYKVGDLVRITGTTDFYQGEMELQVTSIEVIGEGTVEPTAITAAQLNDGSVLGSLVTLSGTVESFEYANGLVQTIYVKDADGNVGRVFIDGYITTAYDVENLAVGAAITVTGLASYDNTFDGPAPRIRVRDRADVVCTDAWQMPFEDVSEDDWFYGDVEWAVRNGITTGVTETLFGPYGSAERCQVVTMLWRMNGCPVPETTENPFIDVSEDAYYYQAVLWAYEKGIVTGTTSTTFSPFLTTERCQVVAMLWRMADQPEATVENPFTDVSEDAYYHDAVLWAYENGITTGATETTFDPAAVCERAAIVAFLCRYDALN